MSSQRSTRSTTSASPIAPLGRRHDPEDHRLPRLQRLGQHVVVGRSLLAEVDGQPARAGAAEQVEGRRGAQLCTHGSAPSSAIAPSTQPSVSDASGGWTVRCRPKPDAVGTAPASTAASAGSSTCTTSRSTPGSRRRRSRTWSRTPSASAWASSRRAPWSARTLSPRGRSTVAARVHGPATWTLNAPAYPSAASSSVSRSWASRLRARRWSIPGASVSRQPAGWRSAPELGDHGQRPAGHRRGGAAARHLGQVREVRQLAEHDPHGLVVGRLVVAGHRARRRWRTSSVRCAAIVAEPTTRVPS